MRKLPLRKWEKWNGICLLNIRLAESKSPARRQTIITANYLLEECQLMALGVLEKTSGKKGKLSQRPGWGKEDKKYWKKVTDDSTDGSLATVQPRRTGCLSRARGLVCLTKDWLERPGGQEISSQREPYGGHCSSPADSEATVSNEIVQGPVLWHDLHTSMLLKPLITPIGVALSKLPPRHESGHLNTSGWWLEVVWESAGSSDPKARLWPRQQQSR